MNQLPGEREEKIHSIKGEDNEAGESEEKCTRWREVTRGAFVSSATPKRFLFFSSSVMFTRSLSSCQTSPSCALFLWSTVHILREVHLTHTPVRVYLYIGRVLCNQSTYTLLRKVMHLFNRSKELFKIVSNLCVASVVCSHCKASSVQVSPLSPPNICEMQGKTFHQILH